LNLINTLFYISLKRINIVMASLGTMNGRTMNAAQDRRPDPDFCYLLRGNITPEPQYRNPDLFLSRAFVQSIRRSSLEINERILDSYVTRSTFLPDSSNSYASFSRSSRNF